MAEQQGEKTDIEAEGSKSLKRPREEALDELPVVASSSTTAAAAAAVTQASEPILSIPKNSIKRIMKLDDDVKQVQSEAVFLVGKATELFLAGLARESYEVSQKDDRRQIKYDHLVDVRLADEKLAFLKHILPERPGFLDK